MNALESTLIGTLGLTLAAGAALLLAVIRRPVEGRVEECGRASMILALGLVCQVLHVAEEFGTRFYERLPIALGLAPWPASFFVILNLSWLAIWGWAVFGMRAGYRPAFFPAWFFAIAAMVNGVAHPLLAIRSGGYFPGLVTSPLLGVVGAWLLIRLVALTDRAERHTSWRGVVLLLETIAFSVIVPGTVTYWLPKHALGLWGEVIPASGSVWHVAALLPLGLGLGVYLKCVWEFATQGRGIPAPLDHPKQLVVTGLYRYVRNPMYLGVLLVLLGEALFFQSTAFLLYALAWLALVHLNVLLYEEPNLTRTFGDSYRHYQVSVRRWIPGPKYRRTP